MIFDPASAQAITLSDEFVETTLPLGFWIRYQGTANPPLSTLKLSRALNPPGQAAASPKVYQPYMSAAFGDHHRVKPLFAVSWHPSPAPTFLASEAPARVQTLAR